jgi:hypothetical protein
MAVVLGAISGNHVSRVPRKSDSLPIKAKLILDSPDRTDRIPGAPKGCASSQAPEPTSLRQHLGWLKRRVATDTCRSPSSCLVAERVEPTRSERSQSFCRRWRHVASAYRCGAALASALSTRRCSHRLPISLATNNPRRWHADQCGRHADEVKTRLGHAKEATGLRPSHLRLCTGMRQAHPAALEGERPLQRPSRFRGRGLAGGARLGKKRHAGGEDQH